MKASNLHIAPNKLFVILLVLGSISTAISAYAQKSKVVAAVNAVQTGDFNKAKTFIDEATANAETSKDPRAWYYKAYIYKELLKKSEIAEHQTVLRSKAIDASKKSLALDSDNEEAKECKKILKYLNQDLYNAAGQNFNKQSFCVALNEYEAYVENLKVYDSNRIDTNACQYLGYSAYKCNKTDKAILYLNKSVLLGKADTNIFHMLAESYLKKKLPDDAILTLEKGINTYTDNKKIRNELINLYQRYKRINQLDLFLQKQIVNSPADIDLLISTAWLYEHKMGIEPDKRTEYLEKAISSYSKVLSLNNNHKLANYNTAILLYNEAVRKINNMNYDVGLTELNMTQDESVDIFKRALPYMEKAYLLEPQNKNTVIGLSGIYFSLNDEAKYKEFKLIAESMK